MSKNCGYIELLIRFYFRPFISANFPYFNISHCSGGGLLRHVVLRQHMTKVRVSTSKILSIYIFTLSAPKEYFFSIKLITRKGCSRYSRDLLNFMLSFMLSFTIYLGAKSTLST